MLAGESYREHFDLLVWPELMIDLYYKSIVSNFVKEVSLYVCLFIAIQNVMPIQKDKTNVSESYSLPSEYDSNHILHPCCQISKESNDI